MGKLMKNGVNYSGFGSPGGSTVEVTPIQTTGTKIATIEVDGVESDLYAPSGGGGGTVHWSTPGAEQSGAYPRLISNNKTLNMGQIISESGSETVYVVQSCSYDWELRGTLPSDLVIGKENTLQMYEGQTNTYPSSASIDFSNYLTLTLDPTTSGLTISNLRFRTSSLMANGSDYTLHLDYGFDATYSGQTMEDQYLGISINIVGTSVDASTGYSYLEV